MFINRKTFSFNFSAVVDLNTLIHVHIYHRRVSLPLILQKRLSVEQMTIKYTIYDLVDNLIYNQSPVFA